MLAPNPLRYFTAKDGIDWRTDMIEIIVFIIAFGTMLRLVSKTFRNNGDSNG